MLPDMLDKQASGPGSRDASEGRGEMSSFGDGVDDDHYCIMTRRFWEFDDEVHTDGVPRCIRDWEGVKLSDRAVPLGLSAKAKVTGRDILSNILGHLGPPVASGHQFQR